MKRAGLLLLLVLVASSARAHEVRPAYLELRERDAQTLDVLWKVPARGDLRLSIDPRFPPDATDIGEPRAFFDAGAFVERRTLARAHGWSGAEIRLDGLEHTRIDVLVRIERLDGSSQTIRVLPTDPDFTIATAPGAWQVAATYLGLGVEHILLGIDHLLFVLALLLLVRTLRQIVGTITAFTLAHSITLAAATLGFVHVPGPPVEACIALSIALVAAEIVRGERGRSSLTFRRPWTIAFAFGLLHGLGFAGALSELGVPERAIVSALLFFNVGVELGQLTFVAAALGALALIRRLPMRVPAWAASAPGYAIGAVAIYWVIERVSAFY